MTAVGKNYFHINLDDSGFTFEKTSLKPNVSASAITTLKKIETILQQKKSLSPAHKGERLSQEELVNLLETKTREIVAGYQSKMATLSWWQKKFFSQEKRVMALKRSIAKLISLSRPQPVPPNLPLEILKIVHGCLSVKDSAALASTCKAAKQDIDPFVLSQAQELGYVGSDLKEAKAYIKEFHLEFKRFCSEPFAKGTIVYKKDGKEVDLTASLAKFQSLKKEFAKTLVKRFDFVNCSCPLIKKYILGVIKKNLSELLPEIMKRKDGEYCTFIHFAAANGYKEAIALILKKGYDIHTRNVNDQTALHVASSFGRKEIVDFLIEAGCDVTISDRFDYRALGYAIQHCHKEIVACLIENGGGFNSVAAQGKTVMHFATSCPIFQEIVQFLIGQGGDINAPDAEGYSPLHKAILERRLGAMRFLIEKGADVNARDADGRTPLHRAIATGDSSLVLFLISKGADVNARDADGRTPLHHAFWVDWNIIPQILVNSGADASIRDNNGRTVLHALFMAYNSYVNSAPSRFLDPKLLSFWTRQFISTRSVDIDSQDNDGATVLHWAATGSRWQLVELLFRQGATIDIRDNTGRTALHRAIINKASPDIIGYLIQYLTSRTTINLQDQDGSTALHLAVRHQYKIGVELLIKKGADVTIRDREGHTAEDYVTDPDMTNVYINAKYTAMYRKLYGDGSGDKRTSSSS